MKKVILVFLFLPLLAQSQVHFSGLTENLIGSKTTLEVSSTDGTKISIQKKNRQVSIISGSTRYSIVSKEEMLLNDSTGNVLLTVGRNGKEYVTSDGDTLHVVRCKGWSICLADRAGNTIAKGKFVFKGDRARVDIVMDDYKVPLAAIIAYRLTNESKKIAESNSWLLTLSSIL